MTDSTGDLMGIAGQTITVSRPGGTNRYGDPLPATEHTVSGCVLAPGSSEEHTDRADQVHAVATVYAPIDADVTATDRLILPDGTRWQVHGFPARYRSPFTSGGVCVISIERVSG